MAAYYLTDYPHTLMNSTYMPIKFNLGIEGGVEINSVPYGNSEIVSVRYEIECLDRETGAYDTTKTTSVRAKKYVGLNLQYETAGSWGNGTVTHFPIDISSICRQHITYDLRPSKEDADQKREWSIRSTTTAFNTFKEFRVRMYAECIDSSGALVEIDTGEEKTFAACNAILEEGLVPAEKQASGLNYWFTSWYWMNHTRYVDDKKLKMQIFSDKPDIRSIREDEVEYFTWLGQGKGDGAGNLAFYPAVNIQFFDLSGNYMNSYARLNDNGAVGGSGIIFNNTANVLWSDNSTIVQTGVGTRNIAALDDSMFGSAGGAVDLSQVGYYVVAVRFVDNTGNVIDWAPGTPETGAMKTITFNIDRETATPTGFVRFHWHNRKGGIDSYTCKGGTTESLTTASSFYETSIYPKFGTRNGVTPNNSSIINDSIVKGYGGVTKNYYPKLSKLGVVANKEFTATTRPLNMDEARWIEDLLVSPNVWIEVIEYTDPVQANGESLYKPVVIKDGTRKLVDSEGLTTIEINYSLSNPRQTQRN